MLRLCEGNQSSYYVSIVCSCICVLSSASYFPPVEGSLFLTVLLGGSELVSQTLLNISCSFVINLRCAESESSDIALHFNPRFTGWDKVVFNSFETDTWGSEEKIRSMPFTKGQPFKVVFMVTTEGYQVRQ